MTLSWSSTLGGEKPAHGGVGEMPTPVPPRASGTVRPGQDPERVRRYVDAAVSKSLDAVSSASEGERNDTLNREAFAVAGLVRGGHLGEHETRAALADAAKRAGLGEHETELTIASAFGAAEPRDLPDMPIRPKRQDADPGEPPPDDGPDPTDDDAPDAPPSEERVKVATVDGKFKPVAHIELMGGDAIFAPLPPVSWVVQGLDIAPGPPVLVAGYGFSAKTVAWQSAGVSVCAGLRVWGTYAAPQGRVVHLDYEQGSRLTCERYQRLTVGLGLGKGDVAPYLSLSCFPRFYLDNPKAEDELCRIFEGATLGLVDSFRAACPSIEENSSDARRPLDMLARVSERTGVVAVVIHHARKPQKDSPGGARMAIRGSAALYDGSASVLVHEGDTSDAPVRVTHEKARITGRLADPFLLRVTDVPDGHDPRAGLLVTAEGAPTAEEATRGRVLARVALLKDEVRGLFEGEPEQTSADTIATKLGRKAADVRQVVAVLIEAGEVEASGTRATRRLNWKGRQ